MKHTLQQVFRSCKFLVGFIIFVVLLLIVLIYPLIIRDAPLEIIGQGTFFPPGIYVSSFDTVNSETTYTLNMDNAATKRIASRATEKQERSLSNNFLFGVLYAVGSLSCTLPIFLVVVGGSLASDGLVGSLGQFVGYALGRPGPCEIPPYDSELVALHVRRSYQGQGIGGQLVAAAAEGLQQRGSQSLLLWVLENNPARSWYERLGGKLIGEKDWGGNEAFGTRVKEVAYGWVKIEETKINR